MSIASLSRWLARLRPVALGLLDGARHRAELARMELEDLRDEAARCAFIGLVAAGMVVLGGMAATLAFAAAVWDRADRVWCLGGLASAYAAGAIALCGWLAWRLRRMRFLPETARQLEADRLGLGAWLRKERPFDPS